MWKITSNFFLCLWENIDCPFHFSPGAKLNSLPWKYLPLLNKSINLSLLTYSLTHWIFRSVVWSGQHLRKQLPNPIKFFCKSLFFGLHSTVRTCWDLSSKLLLPDIFSLYYVMSWAPLLQLQTSTGVLTQLNKLYLKALEISPSFLEDNRNEAMRKLGKEGNTGHRVQGLCSYICSSMCYHRGPARQPHKYCLIHCVMFSL